jgi:hypothetical protein
MKARRCRTYPFNVRALPRSRATLFRRHGLDQKLGSRSRRGWARAGDQLAVLDLGEGRAQAEQFVLDEERHHFVSPASSSSPSMKPSRSCPRQVACFPGVDVAQSTRCVPEKCDQLAGGKKGLDQLDQVLVFRDIPRRAKAARIEDVFVTFLLRAIEAALSS